jgi:glutamate-1-semialdehyde 2,1-aminomutase
LARAFTGRERVLKVGGGWHGAHPWGLVGVHMAAGDQPWGVESEGIPTAVTGEVVVTGYNDPEALRRSFREHGDRLACFIVEPFIGAGGFILATPEYLRTARELADQHGVVLIFDEVISGFRFRAGDLGALYGIRPDLAAFAKIIGGGMPVAAVAGRRDIMQLCGRAGGSRVAFSGGTYSAHPAAMLAARAMLTHLVEHEAEIYPAIGRLGAAMRRAIEDAFAAEGIGPVRCTGEGNAVVEHSSVAIPHFLYRDGGALLRPEDVNDPARCDQLLRDQALQLALLLEDVHVVHGAGTASAAHTLADVTRLGEACRRAARRIKPYLSD